MGKVSLATLASAATSLERTLTMLPPFNWPEWLRDCRTVLARIGRSDSERGKLATDARFALSYMFHDDPDVRKSAFEALVYHRNLDSSWTALAAAPMEYIARHEQDPDIRIEALSQLGSCYISQNLPRVVTFLSKIVRDESRTLAERQAAYSSLLTVRDGIRGG